MHTFSAIITCMLSITKLRHVCVCVCILLPILNKLLQQQHWLDASRCTHALHCTTTLLKCYRARIRWCPKNDDACMKPDRVLNYLICSLLRAEGWAECIINICVCMRVYTCRHVAMRRTIIKEDNKEDHSHHVVRGCARGQSMQWRHGRSSQSARGSIQPQDSQE